MSFNTNNILNPSTTPEPEITTVTVIVRGENKVIEKADFTLLKIAELAQRAGIKTFALLDARGSEIEADDVENIEAGDVVKLMVYDDLG